MRCVSVHMDKEGTGGKAFVSVGAGGKEGFGDEACVGARDKARCASASGSGTGTRRASMSGLGCASGHGDEEDTGDEAFVSVGAGGEEGFGDEACVGARDKDRKTGQ